MKKVIILDFTGCKHVMDFYERIRKAFGFYKGYNMNLDGLSDLLSTECNAEKLIIRGEKTLPKDLYDYAQRYHEIYDDVVKDRERCCRMYSGYKPFSYTVED